MLLQDFTVKDWVDDDKLTILTVELTSGEEIEVEVSALPLRERKTPVEYFTKKDFSIHKYWDKFYMARRSGKSAKKTYDSATATVRFVNASKMACNILVEITKYEGGDLDTLLNSLRDSHFPDVGTAKGEINTKFYKPKPSASDVEDLVYLSQWYESDKIEITSDEREALGALQAGDEIKLNVTVGDEDLMAFINLKELPEPEEEEEEEEEPRSRRRGRKGRGSKTTAASSGTDTDSLLETALGQADIVAAVAERLDKQFMKGDSDISSDVLIQTASVIVGGVANRLSR